MKADLIKPSLRAQLGGLAMFLVLVALPYAMNWILAIRLLGGRGFSTPTGAALGVAFFMVVVVLSELTIGRRNPDLLAYDRTGLFFDADLSPRQKIERLKTSPVFVTYLAAQLVVLCLLALATIIWR